jgi:L-fucose mutarotase/ribose pyranase (RbsD/FucU family)
MNKEQIEAKAEEILKKHIGEGDTIILFGVTNWTCGNVGKNIIAAMCEMYTAALSGIDLDQVVYVPCQILRTVDGKQMDTEGLRKTTIRQLTSK